MIDGRNTTRPPGESEPVTVGEIRRMADVAARLDRIEHVLTALAFHVSRDDLVVLLLDDRDRGAA